MCGRYRLQKDLDDLKVHFRDLGIPPAFASRYNIAPAQNSLVLRLEDGEPELVMMRWGLVPWWSKDDKSGGKCINARSETLATKPSFRDAFRSRRCLVPAHGYYEWTTTMTGKQPWHFQQKGGRVMCFAGLWESWKPKDPVAVPLHSFSIVTCKPSEFAARFHNRMPVILRGENQDQWLDPNGSLDELQGLLAPAPENFLEAWPVTPRMNTPRFESEECMMPVGPPVEP